MVASHRPLRNVLVRAHHVARGMKAASYTGLSPASKRSSAAARASSRKRDTRCELVLRRALWRLGLRYRVDAGSLPGRPDLVFAHARAVVFCDGDFWHGRDLALRLQKLSRGHNAPYWMEKVRTNVARDARNQLALESDGWLVLRAWESDILRDETAVATAIAEQIRARGSGTPRRSRA
jgi:DNA mismatch endonuclease (patch repair protein)